MTASANTTWNLQGTNYSVDTVSHVAVGPGTTYTYLRLTSTKYDMDIFYTTTDLTNKYVQLREIKGGDKVAGSGYVSSMALSKNSDNNLYFAGVNADFFSSTTPIGTTVVDDEIYLTNDGGWQAIGVGRDGKTPYMGTSYLNMTVDMPDANNISATGVNVYRDIDNLVVFTPRYGSTTGTNSYGSEVSLVPVNSGELVSCGATVMKVSAAPVSGVGSMSIPSDGCVLSGHGAGAEYINTLEVGDEVTLNISFSFDDDDAVEIIQSSGGCPMILSDGVVLETQYALDHLTGCHPRTVVGHNGDKTKFVMMAVDGSSSVSDGCTSKTLASLMSMVGCTDALNFDGGGSTVLYLDAFDGIVNNPAEGGERAVTNAWYVVSTAPDDDEIAQIEFAEGSAVLPKYGYYTPKFYGYNQYGVFIDSDLQGVVLSVDESLGEVVNDGTTLLCCGSGSGLLTANYNGVTVTMNVTIEQGEVYFRLSDIIEDGNGEYAIEVLSEIDGVIMSLDNKSFSWWSEDVDIATVGVENGVVLGIADGETVIHASADGFDGSLNVTVEKPTATVMAIEPDMNVNSWNLTQVGGSGLSAEAYENGMVLTYTGSSGRSNYIRLSKSVQLWSLPDAIRLRINPGSAPITSVVYTLATADGDISSYTFSGSLISNQENTLDLTTDTWCDADDRAVYPLTISQIQFGMGTSTTGTKYTVEIPGMECVYNDVPAGVEDVALDSEVVAMVTPNPVNMGECTKLVTSLNGELKVVIYNASGAIMDAFIVEKEGDSVELPTSKLSAGIYIVSINSEKGGAVARLIIK